MPGLWSEEAPDEMRALHWCSLLRLVAKLSLSIIFVRIKKAGVETVPEGKLCPEIVDTCS